MTIDTVFYSHIYLQVVFDPRCPGQSVYHFLIELDPDFITHPRNYGPKFRKGSISRKQFRLSLEVYCAVHHVTRYVTSDIVLQVICAYTYIFCLS